MAIPSAANPGSSRIVAMPLSVKKTAHTAHARTTAAPATAPMTSTAATLNPQPPKASMELPETPSQGMKFVHVYLRNNDECLLTVKKRSDIPFSIIDSVLNLYGLPEELKYLAVIESELKPTAVSRVGAKGPWQLMRSTAHVLGLTVNHKADERRDFYKSSIAAAKYLRDLHNLFGDWLLVLAAYNGGPRPVYRAIRKSHSRDFWVLQKYLPAESRLHVKKFIATAYYFESAAAAEKPAISRTVNITQPKPLTEETANEKFNRIMNESAKSLKASNELLEN